MISTKQSLAISLYAYEACIKIHATDTLQINLIDLIDLGPKVISYDNL